jgi:hypothetical protein
MKILMKTIQVWIKIKLDSDQMEGADVLAELLSMIEA